MYQNEEKISELLTKALLGGLSESEGKELEAWLAESDAHRQMWTGLQKRGRMSRELADLNAVDAREAYDRFCGRERRRVLWRCSRVAAVLLPLGLLVFWAVKFSLQPEVREMPVAGQVAQIVPGSVKAELFLEDGTKYNLGEKEHELQLKENHANVTVSDSRLQYTGGGNADKAGEPKFNTLVVPRGGEYTLTLSDGTTVYLNADSRLKFPEQFAGSEREVFLEGEAFFEVTRQAGASFRVHTQRGTVKVLGTSFNVRAYLDEKVEATTLVTGKVQVKNVADEVVQMVPGEQCCLNGQGAMTKKEVDVYPYIAWKEGIFAFSKEPLEEVMRTLGRWYNVDIRFAREEMKEIPMTGKIKRFSDFQQVLELLETMGIECDVSGGILIVR